MQTNLSESNHSETAYLASYKILQQSLPSWQLLKYLVTAGEGGWRRNSELNVVGSLQKTGKEMARSKITNPGGRN